MWVVVVVAVVIVVDDVDVVVIETSQHLKSNQTKVSQWVVVAVVVVVAVAVDIKSHTNIWLSLLFFQLFNMFGIPSFQFTGTGQFRTAMSNIILPFATSPSPISF